MPLRGAAGAVPAPQERAAAGKGRFPGSSPRPVSRERGRQPQPCTARHSAPEGVEPAAPGEGPQQSHRARMRPSHPQRSPLPASRRGTGMRCSGSSTLRWLFLFRHGAQTLGCASPASLPAAQRCAWRWQGSAALVAVPCSSAPLSCCSCMQLCTSAAGRCLAPAGQKHLLLSWQSITTVQPTACCLAWGKNTTNKHKSNKKCRNGEADRKEEYESDKNSQCRKADLGKTRTEMLSAELLQEEEISRK